MESSLLLAFIALAAVTLFRTAAGVPTDGPRGTNRAMKTETASVLADSSRVADQRLGVLSDSK
jgi:hypothetical protein